MLRFALVDTTVGRIVDYVSFDSPQAPTDLTSLLTSGADCGTNYTPSGAIGAMWCTNRDVTSVFTPTYGIMNQIVASLGSVVADQWPPNQHEADVDFFRFQFGLSPLYYPNGAFWMTNIFDCPYAPARAISLYTSWQANDPLVHYTLPDLSDVLSHQPAFELDTTGYSPLPGLGGKDLFTGQSVGSASPFNIHYRPWGGNPHASLWDLDTTPLTNWELGLKDPLVSHSDYWNFPTNLLSDLSWIGQVHRGTPWQTIYLKSSAIDLVTWTNWTGDGQLTDYGIPGAPLTYDAASTLPTNDWRLAALLISLLSTNDPRTLLLVNEPSEPVWATALDGIVALTNTTSDVQLRRYGLSGFATFETVLVQSNSPQASLIGAGIDAARSSHLGQRFSNAGDILATPELSVASPFLNQGSLTNVYIRPAVYTYQQTYGLSDAAYEAIPAQLLPRLRPDSVASIVLGASPMQVQFSGADGYAYAVEVSSNLVDWTSITTNHPSNGVFTFQESAPPTGARRFYRSALLP